MGSRIRGELLRGVEAPSERVDAGVMRERSSKVGGQAGWGGAGLSLAPT